VTAPSSLSNRPDLLIVGGGLAGGLVALAMARWRPDVRVELIDGAAHFGGNHVWSYFSSDVAGDAVELLAPITVHRWAGYDIAFPKRSRTLRTGYNSVTSEALDTELRRVLGGAARSDTPVARLDQDMVALGSGEHIAAAHILDARGPGAEMAAYDCGWQKFVGQELVLSAPHGLSRPIVMDATVEQIDGYRFVYVLPFGPNRLFVEDTYYSDNAVLDYTAIAPRIGAYAAAHGWAVTAIEREETGVLPVTMGGDFERLWPEHDRVARVGARAGLFHPTTGYSLPKAAALAVDIAKNWGNNDLAATTRDTAKTGWRDGGFYRMLDTMLFRAAIPSQRYRVLEHFYRLPEPTVERFYAGKSTVIDRLRILSGRPPVPISAAIRALAGYGAGRDPKAGTQ
jgi:lycopene beta-cyclase